MPEHKDITDPNIHPPSGYASASNDQVLSKRDDGLGGSEIVWDYPMGEVYGEMGLSNNTTATSTTAAIDGTLNTNTDYIKIAFSPDEWTPTVEKNVTFTGDDLTIVEGGVYLINFWADAKVALNNNFVGIKYLINTSTFGIRKVVVQATTANDIKNIAASGIIDSLSAGDTIGLAVASSLGGNVTFQDAGLNIVRLRG